jgi:Tfp pilus assembly protein PilE
MKSCIAVVIVVLPMLGSTAPLSAQAAQNPATAQRGYVSAMKSDLRTLATAEEAYFMDHNGYFAGTVSADNPLNGFSPSKNVTLSVAAVAGAGLWTATATHTLSPTRCTYKLPEPIVCDPPPPSDTAIFATPRGPGSEPIATVGPRITAIGGADPVGIRAGRSQSWQFDVRPAQTRCTVTGQVVGLSGGDQKVVVLVMTEFAYQDWLLNRPARTYFESSSRTEIPFDVRIEGEGRYRLVVWNPAPGKDSKIIQLQHTEVGCTE